ncbi:hypothetical protein NOC27_882 [Nitrosococcus oceani AFC27]|uniref:ABC transporter substrate-binding protein n=1 Tax=Nitrosococcus oceani C-27 TaxID=314279 RepID=A0A0E2Z2B6_9GAMM|nr:ABC transporter substrate binding protein [Nitrosococcus oceani]EDZ67555.1 hypothetical protein NOC27_882 [Nitrosococcus oceani AFC27]KFI19788.1 ABC transporter substrate-binding protein [Nitrosococcus oceani C-27]GEM19425.1 ABC transporter substrate-binding protein [Nitrosococcus oceani]
MTAGKIRSCRQCFLLLVWFFLGGLGIGPVALADSPAIAVIYPDIREPYRGIFLKIIKGIENKLKKTVKIYPLEKDYDIEAVKYYLRKAQIQGVIVLGSRGLSAAKDLQFMFHVVVGAVLISPNGEDLTGISLTPDPAILFQKLLEIDPRIKRITLIYNRDQTEWLIERAVKAARFYSIEINTFPVENIREAATLYRDILQHLEEGKDAIWLPQDSTIDEQAILPLILKKSWERNLAVFSSNLAHIPRGALFALYPDNERMGQSLAALALEEIKNNKRSIGIIPLRDLLTAVNTRTADHLGLNLTSRMKQNFDLSFPAR